MFLSIQNIHNYSVPLLNPKSYLPTCYVSSPPCSIPIPFKKLETICRVSTALGCRDNLLTCYPLLCLKTVDHDFCTELSETVRIDVAPKYPCVWEMLLHWNLFTRLLEMNIQHKLRNGEGFHCVCTMKVPTDLYTSKVKVYFG